METSSKVKSTGSALADFMRDHKDNEFSWEIIRLIKEETKMPVFAKGIMCMEDAFLALQYGADGIYVSNHGARQLDTTPATIEVLPEIVKIVRQFEQSFTPQKKIEIWFDGGVRRGSDILKALALGADVVWIGRPVLWGLTNGGQTGVE